MKFSAILNEAREWLQREGRLRYRSLQREFDLDDETLQDLRDELIEGQQVAIDENGKVLVWTGAKEEPQKRRAWDSEVSPQSPAPNLQPPASYTPQHLAERVLAEQAAMEARGVADGERKTITALFADLKGSTALIEGLDPEDARAIIDPALQLMMDAVHRYEGYVAQALGDGIFALFGAPIAHEDHPQRALYAALRMQEEMRQYADQVRLKYGAALCMRVGVNTGEVVVRSIRKDDLHTDYVPVGHSTNLAARMEQMAAPGSILVTDDTYKLTEGFFAFQALGAAVIKGVEEPLNVYEVLGAGPLRTRFQVTARRGLTRFVGRHSELDQLRRALEQAKAGHGQIVGVMGEPGLGKSRLFHEFKLTSQTGCLLLEAFSVSHGKASAYLPLIDLLKSYFHIAPQDDERQRQSKVMGQVLSLDRSLEDILPYLFSLLGIEDQSASLQQMDAKIRRRRTFDAVKKLLLRESLNQPLVLIFEDLHWIDTETQEFLDMLAESVASAQVLLLVSYRPEYHSEWGQQTYSTQLRLALLGKDEAEELVSFLLGNDAGLTALKRLILERTEGTPFFMEEVVQTLVEEGALSGERGRYRLQHAPAALHISPTVQGVLAARIDRLEADEKAFLQQLAIIGREFPLGLVRTVVAKPEEELYRLLAALQSKEFLYEQPAFPEVEYMFKHALTQEVAYASVLQEKRKVLHEQTAEAIQELYRANREDHYSELAHHYGQSKNTRKAIEYLGLAGEQALQRSAHTQAISSLTTALELLRTLPEDVQVSQQELLLQISLGTSLLTTKGWAAPEAERAYLRARELCQKVGDTQQAFTTLFGLWLGSLLGGQLHRAGEIAEQLSELAEQASAPTARMLADFSLGNVSFWRGELTAARSFLERGLRVYDRHQHGGLANQYAVDPGVYLLSYLVWTLWHAGFPDQALKRNQEAISLARELSHPHSLVFAVCSKAFVSFLGRDAQGALVQTREVMALANTHGLPDWLAWGTTVHGWALVEQDQLKEGIACLQDGLTASQATGATLLRPWFLTPLAEAYGKTGQIDEALTVTAEALALTQANDIRHYEAELHRVRGELVFNAERRMMNDERKPQQGNAQGYVAEAEACFRNAIEIARRQEAKSLELRAATSLARLWQQQGKLREAHQLLSDIYNWFTEGFDTVDLKDAKALLAELPEGM